ncbi:MAG: hypothetical protein DMD44_06320 [Gemmatimonadetes bacterium]|nr:MAG: hypothetical protein DMD44_06320 [Gemmatimonadota bacterium]
MPARHGRPWWGFAVVAALAAACNNSTGPQAHLADPRQLSTDLQTVSGVLQSGVLASFGIVGTATGSPAKAATPAGALLQAAPLTTPRTAGQPYADAPRRLQALRLAARALGSGISASVIPPQYLGQTFVWDDATHQYVLGPDAGPSNGVRIILYAINPLTATATVAEPSNAVGFVDLLDESTTSPAVNKLHVIVKDGTPASPGPITYANYTVSGSVTGNPATAFNASAIGFVSDGTHTLTFDATFSATNLDTDNPDAQIDVTWDLDNPVIHVALHETLTTSDANHLSVTADFSVTRGTETVAVTGTITVVVAPESVTADLSITVNGVAYARITGTATATTNTIQLVHADGSALAGPEVQAVSDLFDLPAQIETAIDNLFNPCEHLMGA